MQTQLNHQEFKARQHSRSNKIIFILENLEHMENIGSAFRLADAFNIEKIVIISKNDINMQKIKKTARNCEKTVSFVIYHTIDEALAEIKKYGYLPINVEITSSSVPLRECQSNNAEGVALIVGNENYGISEEMLAKVPRSTHIEMYGNNSSMNVIMALAIATYKFSEDLLEKDGE